MTAIRRKPALIRVRRLYLISPPNADKTKGRPQGRVWGVIINGYVMVLMANMICLVVFVVRCNILMICRALFSGTNKSSSNDNVRLFCRFFFNWPKSYRHLLSNLSMVVPDDKGVHVVTSTLPQTVILAV